jgi:hypothetical protein
MKPLWVEAGGPLLPVAVMQAPAPATLKGR